MVMREFNPGLEFIDVHGGRVSENSSENSLVQASGQRCGSVSHFLCVCLLRVFSCFRLRGILGDSSSR